MSTAAPSASKRSLFVLLAVITLVGVMTATRIYSGWIPDDEGVMAQSAERVMLGEVPHRDFTELWTGAVSLVQGAAFKVFGPSLRLMRTLLLVAFLATLPAVYLSARRFASDWTAGLTTLVAAAWSVYSWPWPLPSWYVLFANLWAVAGLIAWFDTRRRGWLLLAGVAAGVSITVKIVGLYVVAAGLLGLAFDVQRTGSAGRATAATAYRLAVTAAAALLLFMVVRLVAPIPGPTPIFHYVMPVGALCGALAWREWNTSYGSAAVPWRAAIASIGPFIIGVAIPVVALATYFVSRGALDDLVRGVFVTPRMRFDVAAYPLPGLRTSLSVVLPLVALGVGGALIRRPLGAPQRAALVVAVVAAIAGMTDGSPIIDFVWLGLRTATPILAVAAAALLARRASGARASIAYLLVAAAAMCSLVQVPMAYYPYYLYFAPIAILAAVALNDGPRAIPREVMAAAAIVLVAFAIRNPSADVERAPRPSTSVLAPGRGNIRVPRGDSAVYGRLAEVVGAHAGEWIYAWHDVPEVYFLTGRRNPTRALYEAFEDSAARAGPAVQRLLGARDVRVVVLTSSEGAAYQLPPDLRAWFETSFPQRAAVGRFTVRWRDTALPPAGPP